MTTAGGERFVDLYLAQADSATVLVLRRSYETDDDGPLLAGRRVVGDDRRPGRRRGGDRVGVTERHRTVRLGAGRLSRTEAMTTRGSWQELPGAQIAPT